MRVFDSNLIRSGCVTALLIAGAAVHVRAQDTCLPHAAGVPFASGPPIWWMGATPAVFATKIDDPRWRGAVAHSFEFGAGAHVTFRGLSRVTGATRELFLSWHVREDPSLDNNLDQLYVGFVPAAGDPLMLRVTAYTTSIAELEAAAVPGVEATRWNGTEWVDTTTPAWVPARTRVWLRNTTPYEWAIHMHVPVSTADTALNLANAFQMWYEVQVQTPAGSVAYQWPRTAVPVHLDGFTNVFPATSTWGTFRSGAAPGSPGCAIGVTLTSGDIGTTNSPAHQMNLTGPNTFFARPLNETGAAIPAGQLRARFRLANWGSTADRHDVADPDALWETIPGGEAVANAAPIANGTKGNLTFNWTLTAAQRAPFESGARRMHQCMLVELSSTAAITLLNASVVRNMDFVPASTFRRDAEISVVGLRRAQATHRVQLFESKRLMPARLEQPTRGEVQAGVRVEAVQAPPNVDLTGVWDTARVSRLLELGRMGPERLEVLYRQGGVTDDDLMRVLPSARVHVYRHDDLRVRKGQTDYPVLRPQTSFGYFVQHTGPLYGWSSSLQGATAGPAPNVYAISIPRDGVARITNVIVAHEEPVRAPGPRIPGCGLGPFAALGSFTGLLLLGLVHRRRRTWP